MRNPFRLTLLLVLAVSSAVLLPGRPQSGRTTAFVGARIIDGTGGRAIEDGALVVEGGRVRAVGSRDEVAIPEDAVRVDLGGRTVIPGLVNAHGHTNQNPEETLRVFARYGVTTVVSLGNEGAAQAALNEAQDGTLELDRARVYFAGPNLAGGVSQALPQVDDRAAMGADFVKIRLDSGQGAVDAAYREVVDRAHALGLLVAAHIYTLEDARTVLEHGTDLVAHSVRDREIDRGLIDLFEANDACISPTLTREVSTFIYQTTPDFFSDPFFQRYADADVVRSLGGGGGRGGGGGEAALRMAQTNLGLLADAGVRVAMGTDAGASTGRFPGYFEHMELELMVEAGLSPMEALVAATGAAAACTDLDGDLGTLEAGKWADFLVLGANPLDDIRNTKSLESVWIAGQRLPDTE